MISDLCKNLVSDYYWLAYAWWIFMLVVIWAFFSKAERSTHPKAWSIAFLSVGVIGAVTCIGVICFYSYLS